MRDFEKIAGYVGLAVVVVADLFFGIIAAIRVAGICCMASGVFWMTMRSIPVGWEGQPPSFLMAGSAALAFGFAMLVGGAVLVVFSSEVACFLGWQDMSRCQ